MADLSYREKIEAAPAGSFHVLDAAKAKRLGGATMYIPSPEDMRATILEIPAGRTQDLKEIRQILADKNNAEITCPFATRQGWLWLAWAAEEDPSDAKYSSVPYWRVLKEGKPYNKLPGGAERQIDRLRAEGVTFPTAKIPNR